MIDGVLSESYIEHILIHIMKKYKLSNEKAFGIFNDIIASLLIQEKQITSLNKGNQDAL